uniref:C2 domain-containing protein n=1 Tax=Cairina moschata TaxID=8855 RepID=A0A8C3B4B5_CAIMO
ITLSQPQRTAKLRSQESGGSLQQLPSLKPEAEAGIFQPSPPPSPPPFSPSAPDPRARPARAAAPSPCPGPPSRGWRLLPARLRPTIQVSPEPSRAQPFALPFSLPLLAPRSPGPGGEARARSGGGGSGAPAWPRGGCAAAARPPEEERRGLAAGTARLGSARGSRAPPGGPLLFPAMSGAMKFNGYLKVRIGEAVGLQPTRWSLRHSLFRKGYQLLDPYVTVSVDQVRVGQTSTKQKTNKPTYNEEFSATVTDGHQLELSVFHDTPIGYDDFVANCTLHFQDLLRSAGPSDSFEGWLCKVVSPFQLSLGAA